MTHKYKTPVKTINRLTIMSIVISAEKTTKKDLFYTLLYANTDVYN